MTELEVMRVWGRFDDLLKARDKTLTDFAAVSGVKYNTISIQRTRHSLPNVEQFATMASYVGSTMEYLLTGEGEVLCAEAQAVQDDPELRALVRAISRDRRLLAAISAVVESYESKADIG